jgi:hypothetical protein
MPSLIESQPHEEEDDFNGTSRFSFSPENLQTNALAVLDLPQLYTRPSFAALTITLTTLTCAAPSWDTAPSAPASRKESPKEATATAGYLTSIVASDLSWLSGDEAEQIRDLASKRLSERTGRSGMSSITRSFRVEEKLELSLHEPALTGDNLGLKTWGTAFLVAKALPSIASQHLSHLLPAASSRNDLEVLELGSGTGLLGLSAASLLPATVTLTDLPEILPNLQKNVDSNAWIAESRGGAAYAEALDWTHYTAHAAASAPDTYPLVMAADPLYSPSHPGWLVPAVDSHLSTAPGARVLLAWPLRDRSTRGWGEDVKRLVAERGYVLVGKGTLEGVDDWEVRGEKVRVVSWWGVWRRGALE